MPERSPQLTAYLERVGWTAPVVPDLATLSALQRAHVEAIPFENLDVQFGRPPGRDPEAIFAKLVNARRGGWCYEMNGLFGRMLEEIGFAVTPLSAGVMRQVRGDFALGSHLCLMVSLDRDYLVDVGFGATLPEPMPIAEGSLGHPPLLCSLERTADDYWRFGEHVAASDEPFTFDFRAERADEAQLDRMCGWLGSDAESPFVQNLIVQRRDGDRRLTLRGRVLSVLGESGEDKRVLGDADDLVRTLRDDFLLDVTEAASLWPAIVARHEALFADQPPVVPTT